MEKRISCRAIITKDDGLVAIFRRKNGKEYYALPGGGIEPSDKDNIHTIQRELKEELSVDVRVLAYLDTIEEETTVQVYYHCEIVSGEIALGGEELDKVCESNYYEPSIISKDMIDKVDVEPKSIIHMVI